MKEQKTVQMVQTALFSGILCVLSPFTVPVPMSPVPFSLATVAVYLAGVLLGVKKSVLCILIYLLLGAVGLPVFSGFSGGIGVLLGPTGGYLFGYLPCALVVGWLADIKSHYTSVGKRRFARYVFAMAVGTLICYLFGTVWFLMVMGGSYTVTQAMVVCVVPYLPLDTVKIFAVAAIAEPIKRILRSEQ